MSVKFPLLFYSFARQYRACLQWAEDGPAVFYTSGVLPQILTEVRRFVGVALQYREVLPETFEQVMAETYRQEAGAAQKIADDALAVSLASVAGDVMETPDLLVQEDDAPVIRLINAMLMEAMRAQASDIHIETFEKLLVVRFRIDGILQEILNLSPALAPLLVSRVKVMAQMDIAERRIPQDGRISLVVGGKAIDVRVSTLPAGAGERVVLRLLDKQAERLQLEHIGLSRSDVETVKHLIGKPHGIILVTGPTGSGKTTTLYSMLERLNDRSRNIMTVEDPIEYQMHGIAQTQVNTKIDMTFARGLRAILRQDPDVVMIGEIRDAETAKIAVQASITGHLVLSTLHTNSAMGGVARLMDMGIEPFLLSSSLVGLIAQRLVRVLCSDCKESYSANHGECEFLGHVEPVILYRAVGCSACRGTGYKGRTAIYEVVPMDETLRGLVHGCAGEGELNRHIRGYCRSIMTDGHEKVLGGITTCHEIMRVTTE